MGAVSIHAPTRGATSNVFDCSKDDLVSIHAPTRGATCAVLDKVGFTQVSIHAPTRGATCQPGASQGVHLVSIHAPTRGATGKKNQWTDGTFVSIHAPTRGATSNSAVSSMTERMFQSTHPHGVRHMTDKDFKYICSFNPRTHTGCDVREVIAPGAVTKVSIHAPTRGAT